MDQNAGCGNGIDANGEIPATKRGKPAREASCQLRAA
jgi:hypothetical protein